jgi:hypothetical protein
MDRAGHSWYKPKQIPSKMDTMTAMIDTTDLTIDYFAELGACLVKAARQ